MAATPQNRRSRSQREEGVGIRETPNAKRAVKQTDPVPAPGVQPNMDQGQLTSGFYLVHAQAFDNLAHITEIKDVLDDHAGRLDRLKPMWSMITRLEETLRQTTTDLAETAKSVVNNDVELKGNLKELESIVTEHSTSIPQLRVDVQNAVKEIAAQSARQQTPNVGVGPTPNVVTNEAMEARLATMSEGVSQSLQAFEKVLAEAQVSFMPTRLGEIAEGMRVLSLRVQHLEASAMAAPAPAPAPAPTAPHTAPESWGSTQWNQQQPPGIPMQQPYVQQPLSGSGVMQPPSFVQQQTHVGHPQHSQQQTRQQSAAPHLSGPQYFGIAGDKKPVFDEKTATSEVMKYPESNQELWMKTTRNYLIGRANEMEQFLEWAESWKSHPISKAAVASLAQSNVCMDNEPLKLSKDLWSYLNLALAGAKDRSGLDNADPGNGFDAWRRIVVPLGPRSAERLETMHDSITAPPKARRLADLERDLDNWDTKLGEYYRCGGEVFAEAFKIRTARKMLPPTVPHTVALELKKVVDKNGSYHEWREILRSNIAYLIDTGGLSGGNNAANVVADGSTAEQQHGPWGPSQHAEGESEQDEGHELLPEIPSADDFPEGTFANEEARARYALVVSRFQRRRAIATPKKKAGPPPKPPGGPGPPRDVRDVKCANCNQTGHTALECSRPKLELSQRKCHKCGKSGHIARFCKEKDPAKVNVVQQEPQPARRILVIRDAPKAAPPPPTIGDYPARPRAHNQRARAAASRLCASFGVCEEPCCAPEATRAEEAPAPIQADFSTRVPDASGTDGGGVRWADSWKPPPRAVPAAQPQDSAAQPRSKSSAKREAKAQRDARFEEDLRAHHEAMTLGVGPAAAASSSTPAAAAAAPPQSRPANPWNAYQRELKKRGLGEGVRISYYMAKEGDREGFDDTMRTKNIPQKVADSAWHIARRTVDQPSNPSQEPLRECTERVERGSDSGARGSESREPTMSPQEILRSRGVLPVTTDDHLQVFQVGEFSERELTLVLDSGCCDHVMDAEEAPGYRVTPSPGSLNGQNFIVGNGDPIPNEGQINLRFGVRDEDGQTRDLASVFQVAEVTNPLMSVSSICDKGFTCVFDSRCGRVVDQDGQTVCQFDRSGGLYAKTVRLQPPEPFHRPA